MIEILVATVGTVGLVVVAIVTPFAARVAGRIKAVQEQVQNDHTTNLRDDMDGKHTENRGLLLAIQRDVAWVMRRLAEQDDRLDALEDTQPKRTTP
jgi:hypothetical protein